MVNEYFKGNPLDYGFREHAFDIPVMVGSVFGEFAFMPAEYDKNALMEEQTKQIISAVYGENTEEMIEAFQKAYPGKHPTDLLYRSCDAPAIQSDCEATCIRKEGGDISV